MNDLNQIRAQNARAVLDQHVPKERARGLFVVAEYDGLHFTGHTTHRTAAEAQAWADGLAVIIGARAEVLPPTHDTEGNELNPQRTNLDVRAAEDQHAAATIERTEIRGDAGVVDAQ